MSGPKGKEKCAHAHCRRFFFLFFEVRILLVYDLELVILSWLLRAEIMSAIYTYLLT